MIKFFKQHWFTLLFSIIFGLYAVFLLIIAFSPRVDAQKRGFIPCTIQLTDELEMCASKGVWCYIGKIARNNVCDFNVITSGFSLWRQGKQKTPWANYYFVPVEPENQDLQNEELKEVYENNAKILEEMEELNNKRIELEMQLDEKEKIENKELLDHINTNDQSLSNDPLEELITKDLRENKKDEGEEKDDNQK